MKKMLASILFFMKRMDINCNIVFFVEADACKANDSFWAIQPFSLNKTKRAAQTALLVFMICSSIYIHPVFVHYFINKGHLSKSD